MGSTYSLSLCILPCDICSILNEKLGSVDSLNGKQGRFTLMIHQIDIPTDGEEVCQELKMGI